MLRLTLRTARAHWRRFVLTTTAVVVGVAFVVGSFVLTDSLAASINTALERAVANTDFAVRPVGGRSFDGGPGSAFGGPRVGITTEQVDRIREVPGVAAADGVVSGGAQLLDKAGQAERFDFGLVSNWPDNPEMFAVRLVEGRSPDGVDDVVIDTVTAEDRGLGVGDDIRFAVRRGVYTATISGLAELGAAGFGGSAPTLAFSAERATELVGETGAVGGVNVRTDDGEGIDTMRERIQVAVGDEASVLSSDTLLAEAQELIDEQLRQFNGLLLGFAAVTLFVSGFLIWNTFSIVVAQRARELALLRAVGASRPQVLRSVIGEGAVVGIVSSGIGLVVGVLIALGLRALLRSFEIPIPTEELIFEPRTAVLGLAIGIGVTLASVIGPALKATRIAPVEAMSKASVPQGRGTVRRPIFSTLALVVGAIAGLRGLLDLDGDVETRVRFVAIGALMLFLGLCGFARYLAGPVVAVLGWPFRTIGRVPSKLASQNAARNPRRTGSTAAALMIGIALVTTTLVVGESVKAAFGGALRDSIRADIVADSGGIAPFDDATVAAIESLPGVRMAVPLERTRADLRDRGSRLGMATGDLSQLLEVVSPGEVDGRLPRTGEEVAIAEEFGEEESYGLGDDIRITSAGIEKTLHVVGVFQHGELIGESIVLPEAVAGLPGAETAVRLVLVDAEAGESATRLATEVERVSANVPNSFADAADAYVESQTSSLDIVLGIINILLLFAVGVAALGIANTLALSVVERTRELGLLRAVGMKRPAARRMVRVEGVIIALFGGVLGLVVGAAFGERARGGAAPADRAARLPGNPDGDAVPGGGGARRHLRHHAGASCRSARRSGGDRRGMSREWVVFQRGWRRSDADGRPTARGLSGVDQHRTAPAREGSDARHRRRRRPFRDAAEPTRHDRRLAHPRVHERGDLPNRHLVAGHRRLRDGPRRASRGCARRARRRRRANGSGTRCTSRRTAPVGCRSISSGWREVSPPGTASR